MSAFKRVVATVLSAALLVFCCLPLAACGEAKAATWAHGDLTEAEVTESIENVMAYYGYDEDVDSWTEYIENREWDEDTETYYIYDEDEEDYVTVSSADEAGDETVYIYDSSLYSYNEVEDPEWPEAATVEDLRAYVIEQLIREQIVDYYIEEYDVQVSDEDVDDYVTEQKEYIELVYMEGVFESYLQLMGYEDLEAFEDEARDTLAEEQLQYVVLGYEEEDDTTYYEMSYVETDAGELYDGETVYTLDDDGEYIEGTYEPDVVYYVYNEDEATYDETPYGDLADGDAVYTYDEDSYVYTETTYDSSTVADDTVYYQADYTSLEEEDLVDGETYYTINSSYEYEETVYEAPEEDESDEDVVYYVYDEDADEYVETSTDDLTHGDVVYTYDEESEEYSRTVYVATFYTYDEDSDEYTEADLDDLADDDTVYTLDSSGEYIEGTYTEIDYDELFEEWLDDEYAAADVEMSDMPSDASYDPANMESDEEEDDETVYYLYDEDADEYTEADADELADGDTVYTYDEDSDEYTETTYSADE